MKQKSRYESPFIQRVVHLQMEGELLSGSVVNHIEVTSMGQDVENFDFSGDSFNHEWQ